MNGSLSQDANRSGSTSSAPSSLIKYFLSSRVLSSVIFSSSHFVLPDSTTVPLNSTFNCSEDNKSRNSFPLAITASLAVVYPPLYAGSKASSPESFSFTFSYIGLNIVPSSEKYSVFSGKMFK